MVYVLEIDIKRLYPAMISPLYSTLPGKRLHKREYIKSAHDISGDIPNVHEQILAVLKRVRYENSGTISRHHPGQT